MRQVNLINKRETIIVMYPLKPYTSDQHQISPCNISTYSTPNAMRINDMITQGEFS